VRGTLCFGPNLREKVAQLSEGIIKCWAVPETRGQGRERFFYGRKQNDGQSGICKRGKRGSNLEDYGGKKGAKLEKTKKKRNHRGSLFPKTWAEGETT